jgi:hypothetical protein
VGVDQREENQLLVFERKVFRTICGPKIENGVYMRRPEDLPQKALFRHSEPNQRKEQSRKTEIQVGGWDEQR